MLQGGLNLLSLTLNMRNHAVVHRVGVPIEGGRRIQGDSSIGPALS